MSQDKRGADSAGRNEFQNVLRLLDRSTSLVLWASIFGLLLLPGIMVLFFFPGLAPGVFFGGITPPALAGGLLLLLWVVTALTVHWQRHLKTFRAHLVEQIDAAAKQRVRAERYYGLSILDPLTGLYNRRFGENRLQEEIARAEKTREPLLLMALDFDRFKEINDNHGHAAGDLALKTFARRLQRAIRACDVPIRVGGDEFLVILPECTQDKVELILGRMKPIEVSLNGKTFPVRFSRGVSQYEVNDTPESMIKRADRRLYEAKARRDSPEGLPTEAEQLQP